MKFILACLMAYTSALAQIIIKPDEYDFPRVEPLKAAISTTFVGTPNGSWIHFKLPIQGRRIKGFRAAQRVNFRYLWPYESDDNGELVYVLTGFGGNASDPKANFLARKLTRSGFHAIILPSIFTAEFVVGASKEGVVGDFERDGKDYFNLMRIATEKASKIRGSEFTKKHIIGFSYGALTAAFVAQRDKTEKVFNLDKEVLINPPTDLLSAADVLDNYLGHKRNMGDYAFTKLFLRIGLTSLWFRRYIPTEQTYAAYLSRTPMSLYQKKALVGMGLASSIPEVTRAVWASLLHDHGHLRGLQRESRHRVQDFDFGDYFRRIILTYGRANHRPDDSLGSINWRNGLYSLEEYFRTTPNVYLIHNRDDFLVQDGDIEFFSRAFGDRFVLYPWGGHMGNLWHPQNVTGLISLLKGKPRWRR